MGHHEADAAARPHARHAAARRPLASLLRPLPALLVVGVVAVGSSAALTVDADPGLRRDDAGTDLLANADPSFSAVSASIPPPERESEVSRSQARTSLSPAAKAEQRLRREVERQARDRRRALRELTRAAERQAAEIAANRWVMPVSGYVLTSGYGPRWGRTHAGTDFAAPTGTPLVAVARGTVTESSYDGGYGNKTVLTLEDGTDVWYCHMNSFSAGVGDVLEAGDPIGTVGSTGNSTGAHLHLEIHPGGGDAVDPVPYLQAEGLRP